MDVQKVMSSAAQQVVYPVERGVLLGRAQRAVLIGDEHAFVAQLFLFKAGLRLAAAADAAAGAGHALDEILAELALGGKFVEALVNQIHTAVNKLLLDITEVQMTADRMPAL